jgi:hypothetical protein
MKHGLIELVLKDARFSQRRLPANVDRLTGPREAHNREVVGEMVKFIIHFAEHVAWLIGGMPSTSSITLLNFRVTVRDSTGNTHRRTRFT